MNFRFWKSQVITPEVKSYSNFNMFEYIARTGWGRVAAFQALRYYEQIAPVATGIDIIVDKFKILQPSIFEEQSQSYDSAHPFSSFLKKPNATQSGNEFFKEFGTYYEVTGEVYLLATGNPNRPPSELSIIPPQHISILMGDDGLPKTYSVNSNRNGRETEFRRKEDASGIRYFNGADREIWHVKNFNPNKSESNFHGASTLNAIYFEIEQHLYSSRHNLSLLQKGGRLTGAMVSAQVLSDDTFKRLKQEIATTIQGADNAGSIPLFDGGTEFKEMGKSMRDMDFVNLKKDVKQDIYTRLKIPLPLVATEKQTLDNYTTAQIALYDDAIIPLQIKLYSELSLFLGDRFRLTDSETLSVNPITISSLEPRRLDNLKKLSDMNILSTNEKRSASGRESANGGDIILAPNNLSAIALDTFILDNKNNPEARDMLKSVINDSAKDDREVMTINERRELIGLAAIEGGDAIYMPASEIPAIEIEP